MQAEYDFSKAKRGVVAETEGKTRVSIYLDDDILAAFRARAETEGKGYQALINAALRVAIDPNAATERVRNESNGGL